MNRSARTTAAITITIATGLLLAIPFAELSAQPAQAQPSLSLDEVLAAAAKRPAARAGINNADALDAAAVIERRTALLPSIRLAASAQERSRELSLTTPAGRFEVADQRRLAASIGIRQPILDPARLFYNAPALRKDAEAAQLAAARNSELYASEAARRYFAILEIDARRFALNAQRTSLESRLAELGALVAAGRALDRDRRRLSLALADIELQRANLARDRQLATLALGVSIGRDVPVEPRGLAPNTISTATTPIRATSSRADVAALKLNQAAAVQRRQGVRAEWIPSLDLEGAWIFDDSLFADQEQFFTVTLNLSWTPLASGTRQARRRAHAAKASSLTHQRIELERAVKLEEQAASLAIQSARATLVVAKRGVDDALEAKRVTVERFRAGRDSVSELLEIEALVGERNTRLELAKIAIARAQIDLRVARGTLLK